MRKLIAANDLQISAERQAELREGVQNRLTQLGEGDASTSMVDAIIKQASGEELSIAEQRSLESSRYGQRVANELNVQNAASGDYSSSWTNDLDGAMEDFIARRNPANQSVSVPFQNGTGQSDLTQMEDIYSDSVQQYLGRSDSTAYSPADRFRNLLQENVDAMDAVWDGGTSNQSGIPQLRIQETFPDLTSGQQAALQSYQDSLTKLTQLTQQRQQLKENYPMGNLMAMQSYSHQIKLIDSQISNLEQSIRAAENTGTLKRLHAEIDIIRQENNFPSTENVIENSFDNGIMEDNNQPETEVILPRKPHRNKTEGHWETILDEVEVMKQSGDYVRIYVNKGLRNEISNALINRRPDVMGVRRDGTIDQVEVPSKTDQQAKLINRMKDSQKMMGNRAGDIKIRNIGGYQSGS